METSTLGNEPVQEGVDVEWRRAGGGQWQTMASYNRADRVRLRLRLRRGEDGLTHVMSS